MKFVEVILPLKLEWTPTYRAPEQVQVGQRVRVIFAHKEYLGVVCALDVVPDVDESKVLEVLEVVEGIAPISPQEMKFWEFMAGYYLCSVGEIFKAAYPAGRLKSEKTAAAALKKRAATAEPDPPAHEEPSSEAPRSHRAPEKPQVIVAVERMDCYAKALEDCLAHGRQALVLCPEKAACSTMAEVLKKIGGAYPVTAVSSDLSPVARRKAADAVRIGQARLVVGTRAALWLPFRDLGLIVIDQEQDIWYKQTEPAPRYHARDAAVALSQIHGAKVLMGTPCPSFETLLNLLGGKYLLSPMSAIGYPSELLGSRPLPMPVGHELVVVDIPAERRKRGMEGPLSRVLIRKANASGGSVVLVRGWENAEETQAQASALLTSCSSIKVLSMAELKRKGAGGASLIAVLQADAFVSREDFRADERALQLVAELSTLAPCIVLQTAVPERFCAPPGGISYGLSSNAASAAGRSVAELLAERRQFAMPPYTRMIDILVQDGNESRLNLMASRLGKLLHISPIPICAKAPKTEPATQKVEAMRLRMYIPRDAGLAARKQELAASIAAFESANKYTGHIIVDVDPI